MNLVNNDRPKVLINIDVGNEIIPEGHLRIKDIKVLPEMQQRALVKDVEEIKKLPPDEQLYELTNDYYVEVYKKMLELSEPPPVTVYLVEQDLILVDGFNRLLASKNAGRKSIPAIVMQGTKEDALRVSCRSNGFHNQDLSNIDRRCCFFTYFNTLTQKEQTDFLSEPENKDRQLSGREAEGLSQNKLLGLLYLSSNNKQTFSNYRKEINNGEFKNKKRNSANDSVKKYWIYLWENASVPEYGHNTMNKIYSISELAKATCFDEKELERWIGTIERKKQAIIYGPPGTGKTFLAKELAKHLTKTGDDSKGDLWDIVQFHPSYSYEDFIQGIRPEIGDQSSTKVNGQIKYKWEKGRFRKFCEKAESHKGKSCVLIIDEINRANLSSVFGELMYLLEYRGENEKIKLAGNGELFGIPENVRIIGTMNTADRSVSPIDNALRRRFAFLHLPPKLEILDSHYKGTNFPIKGLKEVLEDVNKKITDENFQLGVSFFLKMGNKLEQEGYKKQIEDIWKMEIEPYLKANSFILNENIENFNWKEISENFDDLKPND